jgi:hypothetical protein
MKILKGAVEFSLHDMVWKADMTAIVSEDPQYGADADGNRGIQREWWEEFRCEDISVIFGASKFIRQLYDSLHDGGDLLKEIVRLKADAKRHAESIDPESINWEEDEYEVF